jgi:hypothetical protein
MLVPCNHRESNNIIILNLIIFYLNWNEIHINIIYFKISGLSTSPETPIPAITVDRRSDHANRRSKEEGGWPHQLPPGDLAGDPDPSCDAALSAGRGAASPTTRPSSSRTTANSPRSISSARSDQLIASSRIALTPSICRAESDVRPLSRKVGVPNVRPFLRWAGGRPQPHLEPGHSPAGAIKPEGWSPKRRRPLPAPTFRGVSSAVLESLKCPFWGVLRAHAWFRRWS